jgi:hypothetical protein
MSFKLLLPSGMPQSSLGLLHLSSGAAIISGFKVVTPPFEAILGTIKK